MKTKDEQTDVIGVMSIVSVRKRPLTISPDGMSIGQQIDQYLNDEHRNGGGVREVRVKLKK